MVANNGKTRYMKDATQCAFFIRLMPVQVRDQFKAACALTGQSMSQVIISMMKDFIQEAKTGKPRKIRKNIPQLKVEDNDDD